MLIYKINLEVQHVIREVGRWEMEYKYSNVLLQFYTLGEIPHGVPLTNLIAIFKEEDIFALEAMKKTFTSSILVVKCLT